MRPHGCIHQRRRLPRLFLVCAAPFPAASPVERSLRPTTRRRNERMPPPAAFAPRRRTPIMKTLILRVSRCAVAWHRLCVRLDQWDGAAGPAAGRAECAGERRADRRRPTRSPTAVRTTRRKTAISAASSLFRRTPCGVATDATAATGRLRPARARYGVRALRPRSAEQIQHPRANHALSGSSSASTENRLLQRGHISVPAMMQSA